MKSWLASASATQPQATVQQATAACNVSVPTAAEPDREACSLKAPKEASASGSVLGKRPSAKTGNPKQKSAKQRGIAGQSSLKAFMRPQAVQKAEQIAPEAFVSQASGATAGVSLLSREVADAQQMQSQARSQPVSSGTFETAQSPGMGVPEMAELAQLDSQARQPACLSQAAGLRDPEGCFERQSSDRASAEDFPPMQSKRSCASSEADVDELVDAATRWDEVKGMSLLKASPATSPVADAALHANCPRACLRACSRQTEP